MNLEQSLTRLQLIEEFNISPDTSWFGQSTVAVLRGCSKSTVERDRWAGTGVPFVKCGRSVRYSKASILKWLSNHAPVQSTTESQSKERSC